MEMKKLILPVFIITVLILSTFGIIFGKLNDEGGRVYEYDNVKFVKKGNSWIFKSQGNEYSLFFGPRELENVTLDIDIYKILNVGKIYVSINPKEKIGDAYSELLSNIKKISGAFISSACSIDIEECKRFPLKTCGDAGENEMIIIIKEGNDSISYDNRCLVIQGSTVGQLEYVDKFILKATGI